MFLAICPWENKSPLWILWNCLLHSEKMCHVCLSLSWITWRSRGVIIILGLQRFWMGDTFFVFHCILCCTMTLFVSGETLDFIENSMADFHHWNLSWRSILKTGVYFSNDYLQIELCLLICSTLEIQNPAEGSYFFPGNHHRVSFSSGNNLFSEVD